MMSLAFKPIRKKRLFEEIILAIEEYVRDHDIQPGEKLPSESELATMFDVSKTAIREAMSVLHNNAIVETRPGSGIFLKEVRQGISQQILENLMKTDELLEIIEFRRGLEVEAAAIAAMRANAQDIQRIEIAHANLYESNAAGLVGVHQDFMFHQAIVTSSHNSIYIDIFNSLSEKIE